MRPKVRTRAGSSSAGHRRRTWAARSGVLLSGPGLPRGRQHPVPSSIKSRHCPARYRRGPSVGTTRPTVKRMLTAQIELRHPRPSGRHHGGRNDIRGVAQSSADRRPNLDRPCKQLNARNAGTCRTWRVREVFDLIRAGGPSAFVSRGHRARLTGSMGSPLRG